jgi:hypothetical protein
MKSTVERTSLNLMLAILSTSEAPEASYSKTLEAGAQRFGVRRFSVALDFGNCGTGTERGQGQRGDRAIRFGTERGRTERGQSNSI